jgi:hypothetical protein
MTDSSASAKSALAALARSCTVSRLAYVDDTIPVGWLGSSVVNVWVGAAALRSSFWTSKDALTSRLSYASGGAGQSPLSLPAAEVMYVKFQNAVYLARACEPAHIARGREPHARAGRVCVPEGLGGTDAANRARPGQEVDQVRGGAVREAEARGDVCVEPGGARAGDVADGNLLVLVHRALWDDEHDVARQVVRCRVERGHDGKGGKGGEAGWAHGASEESREPLTEIGRAFARALHRRKTACERLGVER